MAAWPSGKAEDCKSFIPSSNLGAALNRDRSALTWFDRAWRTCARRLGLGRAEPLEDRPPGSPVVCGGSLPARDGPKSRLHDRDPAAGRPPRRRGRSSARCCGGRPSPNLQAAPTLCRTKPRPLDGESRHSAQGFCLLKLRLPLRRWLKLWRGDALQSQPPSARRGPWRSAESWGGSRRLAFNCVDPKANLKLCRLSGAHRHQTAYPATFVSSVAGVGYADSLADDSVIGRSPAMAAQHRLSTGV